MPGACSMAETDIRKLIEELYRSDFRAVYAALVRLLGDFELAEEAVQDAFAVAMERWPVDGIPDSPRSWLISTGRHRAIDQSRRAGRFREMQPVVQQRIQEIQTANAQREHAGIEDDQLRLIFTCCHPAIAVEVQIALTLREVCGMRTEEIAAAFLTLPATIAQRIVRGKAKIRDAGIPFEIPSPENYSERLEAVLAAIYLVFNEGYSASSGEALTRRDLSEEAIRLGRLLLQLLPDPEVSGLLALMLLQESRRAARTDAEGDLVLLEEQDRSLWDRNLIHEGQQLVLKSLVSRRFGKYTIQAAIAAVHAEAASPAATDWLQIIGLYDALQTVAPSPVVSLNRAVAVAMGRTLDEGLALVEQILVSGELSEYPLAHATRGELCRRLQRFADARDSFEHALQLTRQVPHRRFLEKRLAECNTEG